MSIETVLVKAPRWILTASIPSLLFLLGVTSEYAREQHGENERLARERQKQFEEVYTDDFRERIGRVEAMVKFHSDDMSEFRISMREFARIVADHGSAVRELAYQVKQLGLKVEAAEKHEED